MRHPQICLALRYIAIFLAFASICPAQLSSGAPPPPAANNQSMPEDSTPVVQRDPALEEPILQQLQKIAPKAVETFKTATTNLDSHKYDDAIFQYNEVLKLAPNFEPAMRRLGYALVGIGQQKEGVAMAQKAADLHRSEDNLMGLVTTILAAQDKTHQPSTSDQEKALVILNEVANMKGENEAEALTLIADITLSLDKSKDFYEVLKRLTDRYPNLVQTHYFNSLALANRGNFDEATGEIDKAESLGLDHAEAVRLRGAFAQAQDESMFGLYTYRNYFKALVGAILLWAIGLVGLFVTGKILSSKTLQAIEGADPNDVTGGGQASLRRFYRKIITIAGVYYYISQPIVAIVVIFATASIVLFFLAVGYVPIKLMLIIIFVGGASIFYMAKSLFTRAKVEDPGRALLEAEGPELWSLVCEVAESVNTRPVDEIRITEGVDLAVYERGGWRVKMQDKAERILILGVANLNGFREGAFTAVLAHEYGHFSNRDTAGGDVAFRVNTDMMRLAEAIVMSGTNSIYNLAFHFIRVYHFLFRRITHGATRLQETLADRVAAHHYGVEAFREGLTHVVRREIEFNYLALKEINSARSAKRAFSSLYDLTVADDPSAKDIETQIEEALNRKTTEDDTHPSPNDRFRLIEKVISLRNIRTDRMVWDLFADRQAITDEMNKNLEGRFYGTKYASANDILT